MLYCAVLGGKAAIVLVHRCHSPSGCIIGSTQAEHFLHFGKYRQGARGCSIDLNLMGGSGRLVHWTATVLPWLIIKQMFFSTAGWLALQAGMGERSEREHKKGGERGGVRNRLSSGWSRLAVRENGWKTLAIRALQSFDSSCSGAPEFTSHYSGPVVGASWCIMFRVISYLSEQSWHPLRKHALLQQSAALCLSTDISMDRLHCCFPFLVHSVQLVQSETSCYTHTVQMGQTQLYFLVSGLIWGSCGSDILSLKLLLQH